MLVVKIIGFVLLGILALVLFVVDLVLFVPIRYKARLKKNDEEFSAEGYAAWLFKLVKIDFSFDGNTREFKKSGRVAFYHLFEEEEEEQDVKEPEKQNKEPEENPEKQEKAYEEPKKISEEPVKEQQVIEQEPVKEPENLKGDYSRGEESTEQIHEDSYEAYEEVRKEPEQDSGKRKQKREKNVKSSKDKKSGEELTFLDKVKNFYSNRDKAEKAYYKTRDHIKRAVKRIKKLIKHVLPRKVYGSLEFGFDDPATTGKVLGGIAALYGITGQFLRVIPHFDESFLDADVKIKGRIRIFTVLLYAGLIYFNKHIRKLLNYFKHLTEAPLE